MTKELNCCGLACPEPVIRCRRLLEEEKPASLRVLVDNTAASENVGRFLGRSGYSVDVRQEGASLWCRFRHSMRMPRHRAGTRRRNPHARQDAGAHHHRNLRARG